MALELGEYLTEANLRVALVGAGAGASVGLAVGLLRRPPWGVVGVLGPLVAYYVTGAYWGWPDPETTRLVALVVVGLLTGHGYSRLSSGHAALAPLAYLASCGGVWLAVPENPPAVLVASVLCGLVLAGRARGAGVGYGLGLALAWAVLLGAPGDGWSFTGGLLCLAPLVAVGVVSVLPVGGRGRLPAWPWFVLGAEAFAAARWVGVAPDASWARVGVVGVAAGVLALVTRTGR